MAPDPDQRWTIYRLVNIESGRFYVGRTTWPLSWRLTTHYYASKRGASPLHRDMARLGKTAFKMEALGTATDLEAPDLEGRMIDELDALWRDGNGRGYNLRREYHPGATDFYARKLKPR